MLAQRTLGRSKFGGTIYDAQVGCWLHGAHGIIVLDHGLLGRRVGPILHENCRPPLGESTARYPVLGWFMSLFRGAPEHEKVTIGRLGVDRVFSLPDARPRHPSP